MLLKPNKNIAYPCYTTDLFVVSLTALFLLCEDEGKDRVRKLKPSNSNLLNFSRLSIFIDGDVLKHPFGYTISITG